MEIIKIISQAPAISANIDWAFIPTLLGAILVFLAAMRGHKNNLIKQQAEHDQKVEELKLDQKVNNFEIHKSAIETLVKENAYYIKKIKRLEAKLEQMERKIEILEKDQDRTNEELFNTGE